MNSVDIIKVVALITALILLALMTGCASVPDLEAEQLSAPVFQTFKFSVPRYE